MCVCPTIATSNHDAGKTAIAAIRTPPPSLSPLSRENTKTDSSIPILAPANLPILNSNNRQPTTPATL